MPPKKNGKAVPKQTAKSKFLGAPKKKPDEFDVDAMMSNVDLPMGLREIQAQIISEIESSKGDEWATSELMEELGALYSACRDAGIV